MDPKNTRPIEDDPGQLSTGTQISETWKLALQELQSYLESEERNVPSVQRFLSCASAVHSGENSPTSACTKVETNCVKSSAAAGTTVERSNTTQCVSDGETKENNEKAREETGGLSLVLEEGDENKAVLNYVEPVDGGLQRESLNHEAAPAVTNVRKRHHSSSSDVSISSGDDDSAPLGKRAFRVSVRSLTSQPVGEEDRSSEQSPHILETDSLKEDDMLFGKHFFGDLFCLV